MMSTDTMPAVLVVPPIDCGKSKAERKTFNRELAEWLRSNGIPANGAAWDAACYGAERDLARLVDIMRTDGERLPFLAGYVLPLVLEPGDFLPDHGGHVVSVLPDPETGAHWLTVKRAARRLSGDEYQAGLASVDDVEIPAGERVQVTRKAARRAVR